MSDYEEECVSEEAPRRLLFNTELAASDRLSVLVVSSQKFCDRLLLALRTLSQRDYRSEIKIKVAEGVDDILTSDTPESVFDYVVLVFDTSSRNSFDAVRANLVLVGGDLLCTRVCLVNGTARSGQEDLADVLHALAEDYRLPCADMEIMDNESCRYGAKRILLAATLSSGYAYGYPVVLPTPSEITVLLD